MIVGYLIPHMEQDVYNNLLAMQGLTNYATFSTHKGGGLLDHVMTDLPKANIHCQQLAPVGRSDRYAILSKVELLAAREDAMHHAYHLALGQDRLTSHP